LPEESIFVGEVGLIGEIRKSMNIESRIKESQKLGFKNIYCHLEKNENSKTNNSVRNFGYLMDFLGSIN
jgi:DNA repair protein RadA/Sms